jgi:hypothetical protein
MPSRRLRAGRLAYLGLPNNGCWSASQPLLALISAPREALLLAHELVTTVVLVFLAAAGVGA